MVVGVGWLLRLRPLLFESVARCWKGAAVLAVFAFLPIAWVEWNWPGDMRAPGGAIILFHIARQVQGWAAIVAFVGVADRFLNSDPPRRALLDEEVVPFYIIHQTIIVVIGWYLLPAGGLCRASSRERGGQYV